MAPAQDEPLVGKPGTACVCCRRRKLKCSREPSGCANCHKADLPCIYPTVDPSIKRKRGPYRKKDKPAREAHLEHVVKYLSDPVPSQPSSSKTSEEQPRSLPAPPGLNFEREQTALHQLAASEPERASEDLVKDALIALTHASISNERYAEDDVQTAPDMFFRRGPFTPSPQQITDLWHLFVTRVDPITKVVHCPTFSSKLSSLLDGHAAPSTANLAAAVFYAATLSCSTEECLSILHQSRGFLLKSFEQVLDENLLRSPVVPDLEHMQALLVYLICFGREDSGPRTWALFSETVRSAQQIDMHLDPGTKYTPYEAEIRRRLWWAICSAEHLCSENGGRYHMSNCTVRLPANIEDIDISPGTLEPPEPRLGMTSMCFVLVRWEIMRSNVRMWATSKANHGAIDTGQRKKMQDEFGKLGKLIEEKYLRYCHSSRPYDWMILGQADVLMVSRFVTSMPCHADMTDQNPPYDPASCRGSAGRHTHRRTTTGDATAIRSRHSYDLQATQ